MVGATPGRPVLRYFGGKWKLAPWIISHLPAHRLYVEPFGGAASVLMLKPRSYAEIYNDIDSEVVNVFRVLRDPGTSEALEAILRLTPFSRDDFNSAWEPSYDPVEQARRTLLKAFAGYGSDSIHRPSQRGMRTRASVWKSTTGFRTTAHRQRGSTPASEWATWPNQMRTFCERLQGVVIENRPAEKVITQYDDLDALIYADPPYVHASRRRLDHGYRQEMSDEDHSRLAEILHGVRGMVVLSGYHSELYDRLYRGWRTAETSHYIGDGERSVEVLWFSPNCQAREGELW